jgi:FMN-dependent NADH-azoreductase
MKNILVIQSSAGGSHSYSRKVSNHVLDGLQARYPGANVVVRDLVDNPPPHIGSDFIAGTHSQSSDLTEEQRSAIALSDSLIAELEGADLVVLSVPMYNFSIPSTLKAWIDHIVRMGRTFSYSEAGPAPLLKGKQAILVLSSGGVYSSGPYKTMDFEEPYLRGILGFIGISDVQVVRVEGVSRGPEATEKATAAAIQQAELVLERLS